MAMFKDYLEQTVSVKGEREVKDRHERRKGLSMKDKHRRKRRICNANHCQFIKGQLDQTSVTTFHYHYKQKTSRKLQMRSLSLKKTKRNSNWKKKHFIYTPNINDYLLNVERHRPRTK